MAEGLRRLEKYDEARAAIADAWRLNKNKNFAKYISDQERLLNAVNKPKDQ